MDNGVCVGWGVLFWLITNYVTLQAYKMAWISLGQLLVSTEGERGVG